MKTKMMKKLISIACAAAMATSCTAMSVGAAPGDYDATGLNRSYYQIGNFVDYTDMFRDMLRDRRNFSPSFARDFFGNLVVMLRGRAGMFAEHQNRFRELANRAGQMLNNETVEDFNSLAYELEDLANNFLVDLADDGRAFDGFVMPGYYGNHSVMGNINCVLDNLRGLIIDLRSGDLNTARKAAVWLCGNPAGFWGMQMLAAVENEAFNKFVSYLYPAAEQITYMLEFAKYKKGDNIPNPNPGSDPTPTPDSDPTPTPGSNGNGIDDELMAVELQLNEFGESVLDHPSYNDAKATAASYQQAIADSIRDNKPDTSNDEKMAVELQLSEFGDSISNYSSYSDAKETAANYQRSIARDCGANLEPNSDNSQKDDIVAIDRQSNSNIIVNELSIRVEEQNQPKKEQNQSKRDLSQTQVELKVSQSQVEAKADKNSSSNSDNQQNANLNDFKPNESLVSRVAERSNF